MASNNVSNLGYVIYWSLFFLLLPRRQPLASLLRNGYNGNSNDYASALPAGVSKLCAVVAAYGYRCEEFQVTTADGYILGIHRIPQGRGAGGGGGPQRQPVVLQHGVLVDGMTWVSNPPEQSLAMALADNGMDVWISNVRGTQFSRRHVTLQPTDPAFWNWTWDELAAYELPSVLEMVIQQTGQKPHYVGHSMGTLIALVSLYQGNFQKSVKSAALLCPIAFLDDMKSPVAVVAARAFLGEIGITFGLAEFDPRGPAGGAFLEAVCAVPGVNCYDSLAALTGPNCCLNESMIQTVLQNEPQPTATKNLVHFAQTIRSGVLSKFDYGSPERNMQYYGSNFSEPPRYDLRRIPPDFPLLLSYGGLDALSDPQDVAQLLDILKLQERDRLQVQYIKEYAHADFILGITARDLVYNEILKFFGNYN